jgi:uncharacterized protein (TIGR00255 family)
MIQSMTGYGSAEQTDGGVSYALEIRSVNNRYLKLTLKLPDYLQYLESDVERQLRGRLARGTVHCVLRVRGEVDAEQAGVNLAALQRYVDVLARVRVPAQLHPVIDLAAMLQLPGVCEAADLDDEAKQKEQKTVERLLGKALDALAAMRTEEGRALQRDLTLSCEAIRTALTTVRQRAPSVVGEYHERLRSRVAVLMQAGNYELEADALAREVAVYAERCDVSEEVTRLTSHLDQFIQLCQRGDQVGRTLDFLTQELLREANTIASKSNDAEIARSVVDIKGRIDRLREQVQNVE